MKQAKTLFLTFIAAGIFTFTYAQDIPQSQIPAPVRSAFSAHFAGASDIEWEMSGSLFKVVFEMDRSIDHEVWYDKEGKMIKHQEEISVKELPKRIRDMIKKDFGNYTFDDLERITDNGTVVYKIELNSLLHQDWDIVVDTNGKILSKIAD